MIDHTAPSRAATEEALAARAWEYVEALEELRKQLETDAYNDAHDRWIAGEDESDGR
jgi:hypothetical protein